MSKIHEILHMHHTFVHLVSQKNDIFILFLCFFCNFTIHSQAHNTAVYYPAPYYFFMSHHTTEMSSSPSSALVSVEMKQQLIFF